MVGLQGVLANLYSRSEGHSSVQVIKEMARHLCGIGQTTQRYMCGCMLNNMEEHAEDDAEDAAGSGTVRYYTQY